MHDATLYDRKKIGGAYNVDMKLDDANHDKVTNSNDGDVVVVSGTAVKGHTGNLGQVFIKPSYEELFVGGIELESVEVTSVNGKEVSPSNFAGDLFPNGTTVTLRGTRVGV